MSAANVNPIEPLFDKDGNPTNEAELIAYNERRSKSGAVDPLNEQARKLPEIIANFAKQNEPPTDAESTQEKTNAETVSEQSDSSDISLPIDSPNEPPLNEAPSNEPFKDLLMGLREWIEIDDAQIMKKQWPRGAKDIYILFL